MPTVEGEAAVAYCLRTCNMSAQLLAAPASGGRSELAAAALARPPVVSMRPLAGVLEALEAGVTAGDEVCKCDK